MRIVIVLPTKGRPRRMLTRAMEVSAQPLPNGVEELILALGLVEDDGPSWATARTLSSTWRDSDVRVTVTKRPADSSPVDGFNRIYKAHRKFAEWYVLGSDDQVYAGNWLAAALWVASTTAAQVIGLNDGHTDLEAYAPHYMVTGEFIETHLDGCLAPPFYYSWWFDREVCEKAQRLGLYAPAWLARVEHLHPNWGTAGMDGTYREAWPHHEEDRKIYLARRRNGYPAISERMA